MSGKPYRDKSTLKHLYYEKGWPTTEIGDRFGVSASTVRRWMEKHGLERRDSVKATTAARRKEYATFLTKPSGYETWATRNNGGMDWVYVHRLLAVAEFGFKAVRDLDIHHKNNINWDNRHENVALLTKESHGQLHSHEHHNIHPDQ